jgi:hypothetical protein
LVPAYRFYRLDAAGKIVKGDWIAADSDEQALEHARERAENGYYEVWERQRLVGRAPEPKA